MPHTLVDERGEWQQRIRAVLYHHGLPVRQELQLLTAPGREWLAGLKRPTAATEQLTVALEIIDAIDKQIAPIDWELRRFAQRQPGCRSLMGHYGIGELSAVAIVAELG